MTPFARRSARVVLVDGLERVLLLRYDRVPTEPVHGSVWMTPGGGVEPGEALVEAASRELYEEVGLTVPPARLRPLAYTAGHADLGWCEGLFRDDFFLHRVHRHQVDVRGQNADELVTFQGHRWWTLADLAATAEIVYPFGLSDLLARVLDGELPASPVELPWHHQDDAVIGRQPG